MRMRWKRGWSSRWIGEGGGGGGGGGRGFIVFGVLNGAALVTNHIWRHAKLTMPPILGWFLTFHFFSFTLVIFRATSWTDALKVYQGMFGFSDNSLQISIDKMMGSQQAWFYDLANDTAQKDVWATWLMTGTVLAFIGIVTLAPNSMELKDRFRPSKGTLLAQVFMFIASILLISKASQFIYFQF